MIIAFLHSDDQHHAWALETVPSLESPLLTCEAVLAEAAFHLRSAEVVLQLVDTGFLRIAFDLRAQLDAVMDLAARYADRVPDLADLCLVRMSELYPRHTLVTVDESDFRVYRRNKREPIPLLVPPRS